MKPIGVDLDGVVVRPPLGWNITISRRLDLPVLAPDGTIEGTDPRFRSLVRSWLEYGRYALRRPMPGVRDGFAELAKVREIHVISARSHAGLASTERWLEKHGLLTHVRAIHLKPQGVRPPYFKTWTLQRLGIPEHVDDDGATAHYLASHAGITVYLCDWPRNRGLPYPERVHVVPDLAAVASKLLP